MAMKPSSKFKRMDLREKGAPKASGSMKARGRHDPGWNADGRPGTANMEKSPIAAFGTMAAATLGGNKSSKKDVDEYLRRKRLDKLKEFAKSPKGYN